MPRSAPRPKILDLGGRRTLGVRDWPGRAPAVVLLHGLLDTAEGWDTVAGTLPQRAIAVDLPGFGASSLPTRPRISAYAQDVLAGLDALRLRELVLVGHSLGGAVATAIADRAPERVAGLVLLAPAGFGRIPMAEAISVPGIRHAARRVLPLALANRLLLTAAYRMVITAGAAPAEGVLERVLATGGAAVPGAVDATHAVVAAGLSRRGFHRRRLAYDGPVHVVWGGADLIVPRAHARGVQAAFPQAAVEVWPGMGHHPQRERPQELVALLRGVVAEARAARPAPSRRTAAA